MAKELDNFINNVCCADEWIAGPENHDFVLKMADILRKSYRGDELKRPDGYYKEENNVYIIEHFEFDSSKPFKGSLNKVELDRVNKDFNKVQNTQSIYHNQLNCNYTYDFYKKRLEETYNNHYKKIDGYKEILKNMGIINDNSIVTTIFCIEDTSALGSTNYKNYKPYIILPTHCKSFLDLFEQSLDLDIVICRSSYRNQVSFLDKNNISYYRNKELEDNEIMLIDWNPQVAGFSIDIPNNMSNTGK